MSIALAEYSAKGIPHHSTAIGVRVNKLPITPADVLEAIESKGE